MKFLFSKLLFLLVASLNVIHVNSQNNNYITNQSPLIDVPFYALPLGSIKADGWLLKQLELQKDGLTGYSETLYRSADDLGAGCDWLGGTGNSWERAPYYVKGLIALAYTLNDETLKNRTQKWIDWSLNSQDENGFFGPPNNTEWWPRMPMLYAIRDYYDATQDARVLPFFTKYFQYELNHLDEVPLIYWGKARAGDNMEIVLWLYNRTGDQFLLELADKLEAQAYDWTNILKANYFNGFVGDFYPKHNVNVPQGIKMPAIYYQKSQSDNDKIAFTEGTEHLMHDHGQPEGMQSGNEMLAGKSSLTGLEMCSIVEQMQSCETVQMITGDVSVGDQLEKVAFNALPGGVSKDFKGLQYYTQANQVKSADGHHGFGQQYNNGLMPGPYSGYGCCRFNLHMGWPYYVKTMWAATNDNGLAALAYGPSEVTAMVADHVEVTIKETTNYPFAESLVFELTSSENVAFPLKLRIPEWCSNPQITVNGLAQTNVVSGEFYTIDRTWSNNDVVELSLPMEIVINDEVNQSVSVQRGPIVYSLKIDENWSVKNDFGNGFKEYEVLPQTAWNYALILDKNNPENSITVNQHTMPENPFLQSTTPITLTVNAKKTDKWKYTINGLMASDPPFGSVSSDYATEQVELVPFGAENIRVTCFPVIGESQLLTETFEDDFNDGNYEGWVEYSGSFMTRNNELISTNTVGTPGSKAIQSATSFADFTLDVRMQVGNTGDAGIIFRASDLSFNPDDYNGYYFGLSAERNELILGKANGGWQALKIISNTINNDTWYNIRVIAEGNNLKIFVNDMTSPKIEFNDASFTSGSIGVRTYSALAKWDDIKVISSSATELKNVSSDHKIKIYPNPTNDSIHINFSESDLGKCQIKLYSEAGKLMQSGKRNQEETEFVFDRKRMKAGTYIIKIESDKDVVNSQVVVI
ncbi:beta-L-arabinofuranosidase domain-containing protein [Carboxylicivirga caseinilyticus]|uniref:beta-L-arabinofuranosidase domain-containing protein n=1 Tax=Carboxylicivirga caseinilyticus TaxID=3417572 RepID=UPI003D32B19B|nr:glycoside hydrolase family 127 protein [Marinilabiliaceae bacterium A049]